MVDYVELHTHSYYSFLDGTSSPQALVQQAAKLEMPAIALTDHNGLYGAIPFTQAAQEFGVQPIYGAELTLSDGHHLTLLAEDETGWQNLCQLITLGQHNAPKGQASLPLEALADHTTGLIALSGCRQGEIAAAILNKAFAEASAAAWRYREWFGPDNFYIELHHHARPEDGVLVADLVDLASEIGVGYVATNNVHYPTRRDKQLHDILVCIRERISLVEAGTRLRPNDEYHLKTGCQLAPRFEAYPEALATTLTLADRCQFDLRYGLQDLPPFPTPAGFDTDGYLRYLCHQALPRRYGDPSPQVCQQLDYEFSVIRQTGLANYFLIVWDIVQFALKNDILIQGRGSAANSIVAYLLDITPVDPIEHKLVFERFLSTERGLPPDIDLDIQAGDEREAVIQYVYDRYGVEHAAMAATFITFRRKSALRDVGKALGLSEEIIEKAAQRWRDGDRDEAVEQAANGLDDEGTLHQLLRLSRQIHGLPRHLGLHNGGMVVSGPPLATRLATEPAAMTDRTVVQADKDALETAGIVKIDLLGLRMLSAIAEATTLIKKTTGCDPALERLTFDDPTVYQMIAAGDTIGVFQVESRAQAQVLPRIKPACFSDLMVTISLIRPGPIQANMVKPYLNRRTGVEPVDYIHPRLQDALADTLGVILFQEQVAKIARDLAGFSLGAGEQLRRALGSKQQTIEQFRDAFLAGALANGVTASEAETVFEQLVAFGGYSFSKAHAAAFAVLVYRSAWLKRYHPLPFYTALLNNQPMGFWSPAVLVGDARRHGISTLPVDISASSARCTLEKGAIRLGFNYVKGLGEVNIERIESIRQHGPFSDLADFCYRTRLPQRLIERLILAGAFDRWRVPRRKLLWELNEILYQPTESLELILPDQDVHLPPLTPAEAMAFEYALLGLSPGRQIMERYRSWLTKQGILDSQNLQQQPDSNLIWVAGQMVVHQAPPTAKGFHFITLEDEFGLMDLILRPRVYQQLRQLLRSTALLVVEGRVQHQNGVVNLLVERAGALPKSNGLSG